MADLEPSSSFADSIRVARERLAMELRAQAEHILKLNQDLAELQLLHGRTEQEASRQWDEITRVADEVTHAAEEAAHSAAAHEAAQAAAAHEAAEAAKAAAALEAAEAAQAAVAAVPKVSPDAALEKVLTAVRSLMACTIPDQVFEVLTEEAAEWGLRAAIFDVRGKAAWGASAHGFGPALSEKVLRSLIVQLNQDNPFRQVCETSGHVDASAETLKRNRNILDKLKPVPGAPILLLPIRSAGTVAAIYYADAGDKKIELPDNALKILAEFAGAQIDRVIALSGGFSGDAPVEEDVVAPEPSPAVEEVREAAIDQAPVEVPAEPPAQEPAPVEPVAEAPAQPAEEPVQAEPAAPESAREEYYASETVYGLPLSSVRMSAEPAAAETVQIEPPPAEPVQEAPAVQESPVEVPVIGATVGEVHSEVQVVEPSVPVPELPPPPGEVPVESVEPQGGVAQAVEIDPAPPVIEPAVEAVAEPPAVEPPPAEPVAESAPPPAVPAVFDAAQLSEEERTMHKFAKGQAKLVVSELLLYNKGKVADGRQNRDLYKRLKSDIDRGRQHFENRCVKKIGKSLSKQFDYYHDELVKTLAANDVSVLGPEYPGPSA